MPPIAFASSNKEKFAVAKHICDSAGIAVEQLVLEIDEIQGENPELIVKAKAEAAFAAYGKPVVVSDDSWNIVSLGGFPGAYMKSINYWFKSEDFLRLMEGVEDRSVFLHQYLAYIDEHETVIFTTDIPATILKEVHGDHQKAPWMNVVSMQGDNGKSLAEIFTATEQLHPDRYKNRPEAWHNLTKWYKEKHA